MLRGGSLSSHAEYVTWMAAAAGASILLLGVAIRHYERGGVHE